MPVDQPPGTARPDTVDLRKYVFRGDDNYQGGPIGIAFGPEADSADIQDFAEHVLRKESSLTSRYRSFSTETKVARSFTSAPDNRSVIKVDSARLRELEGEGILKVWEPDRVYEKLKAGPKKLARQAGDVRAAMRRNGEILVEGQIPGNAIAPMV